MNKILLTTLLSTASIPQISSFLLPSCPSLRHYSTSSTLAATMLEGREIDGALAPTNNFILVKKAAVQEQTEGGILLTGSVSVVCVVVVVYIL
jgi:hypothetical protein